MALSRMQDIAGIRIVVPQMSDVLKISEDFKGTKSSVFELKPTDTNHINKPKDDGYRSLHQIFKYTSKKRPELSGMLVELQIRTRLQHQWATAVEVLGAILKTSFKSGEGSDEYKEFFRLCSALISHKEDMPVIEKYNDMDIKDICNRINFLDGSLNILDHLSALAVTHRNFGESGEAKKADQVLIILDLDARRLRVRYFTKAERDIAQREYNKAEADIKNHNKNNDALLASVNNFQQIRQAYPNYFLDSKEFNKTIKSLLKEHCPNS